MIKDCWLWARSTDKDDYGRAWSPVTKRMEVAHRLIYEAMVGDIPDGLEIDHLCKIRRCINPDHLEPVTTKENILRSGGVAAINSLKTHCLNGHKLEGGNLYIYSNNRKRACRACYCKRARERYLKLKIAGALF